MKRNIGNIISFINFSLICCVFCLKSQLKIDIKSRVDQAWVYCQPIDRPNHKKFEEFQSTIYHGEAIIDQSGKRLRAKSYQSHHSIDPIKDRHSRIKRKSNHITT